MTFRCEACNEVNKRPVTVVLEDRAVSYATLDKDGNHHQGHEVVKEMRVCEPCADLLVPV